MNQGSGDDTMIGGSQQSMGGNEGDETTARQKQKAIAFRTTGTGMALVLLMVRLSHNHFI